MVKLINENVVQYIKDSIEISDIVKEKIKLQKNGQIFKGLCPFHREKTPSFIVNNQRKTFHCFGCGAHGDIFTFLQKTTTLTFQDILNDLSNKLGIQINSFSKKNDNYQEKLKILELTTQYFEKNLANNQEAQHYLQQRMINKETIKKFRLGYIANNNDLYKFLLKNKCNLNLALELGILSQKNIKIYDYFFNRLIFPIINIKNKVVGFGGRVINKSNKSAKYINSKESDVFQKTELLYGENLLNQYKSAIFITEGYFDALSMDQNNFPTMAIMGTSFNIKNLQKLQKYTKKIYLFFDADEAGTKALHKTVIEEIIPHINTNFEIYVIIPNKNFKDPHEIMTSPCKVAQMKKLIINSIPISEFIWKVISKNYIKNINPEIISILESEIEKITKKIIHSKIQKNYTLYFEKKIRDIVRYNANHKKNITPIRKLNNICNKKLTIQYQSRTS